MVLLLLILGIFSKLKRWEAVSSSANMALVLCTVAKFKRKTNSVNWNGQRKQAASQGSPVMPHVCKTSVLGKQSWVLLYRQSISSPSTDLLPLPLANAATSLPRPSCCLSQCRYPPVWFPALLPSSAPQDLKKPAQAVTCQPSPWPSLGPPNLRPPNLLSSSAPALHKGPPVSFGERQNPWSGCDGGGSNARLFTLSPCVTHFLRTILEVCCIVLVSSSCAVLPSFVLLFSAVSMSCLPPCLLPAQHPMPCQSYSSMPGLMLLDSCDKHHQFWLVFFFLQCCFSFFTLLFMLGSSSL